MSTDFLWPCSLVNRVLTYWKFFAALCKIFSTKFVSAWSKETWKVQSYFSNIAFLNGSFTGNQRWLEPSDGWSWLSRGRNSNEAGQSYISMRQNVSSSSSGVYLKREGGSGPHYRCFLNHTLVFFSNWYSIQNHIAMCTFFNKSWERLR